MRFVARCGGIEVELGFGFGFGFGCGFAREGDVPTIYDCVRIRIPQSAFSSERPSRR